MRQMPVISQAMLFMATITALHLLTNDARGEPPQSESKVGEEYVISRKYETSQQISDGSSGSSRGRDVFLERVVKVREGGLELEYDLPKDATVEDRARSWQFPARVFRPTKGAIQLLNRPELEARIDIWLKAAKLSRADCGRWTFTWNAFRIECDPQSVIKTIEDFDLRYADLREGAPHHETGALGTGAFIRKAAGQTGATFAVEMKIDPDAVRRARADADIATGEILRKPVALEAALRERAKESVSGTISVTFDTDAAGIVRWRTKVTKVQTQRPDGSSESQIVTETVERHPASEVAAFR
jgi:hypothetical protein